MKKIVTSSLFAVMALAASAEILTPAQALQRAGGQMRVASLSGAAAATPVMTVNAADHKPALYVFGSSESAPGFAILSADDLAVPVLGYADNGSFSASDIPANMQAWLDFYAEEIAVARANEAALSDDNGRPRMTRPRREPIAPICTTKWSQDAPYNNMCPREGLRSSYTGCVATAVAQVLKTYEYPAKCIGGEYTYSYYMDGIESPQYLREATLNFDEVELDWASMVDSYSGTTTAEQRNAVAQLMYAVGVASDMKYGPSQSGANAGYTAQGLIRHFDYSRDLTYERRDWYDLLTWENMIYSTLAGGHAVYYDGSNSNNSAGNLSPIGAHAFVVDGYTGDGFFHINWGWAGGSDGYFLLSSLDPSTQGIGGSSSGYSFLQGTLANLAPKTSSRVVAPVVFALTDEFGVTPSSIVATSSARVTFSGGFYNVTPTTCLNSRFATRYTAADGTQTYADGILTIPQLDLYIGVDEYVCKVPTGLADGRYIVEPMMKSSAGRYFEVRTEVGGGGQLIAEVSGSTITFSKPRHASVTVSEADVPSVMYGGTKVTVNGLLDNPTDQWYLGGIRATFVSSNSTADKVYKIDEAERAVAVDVAADSEAEFALTFTVPSNFSAGDCKFCITDYTGQVISDLYDVSLSRNPGNVEFSSASAISVTSAAANELRFAVDAEATSGYYSGPLTVVVRNTDNGTRREFLSKNFNISGGETRTVIVDGDYTGGVVGQTYTAQAFYSLNGQTYNITQPVEFVMTAPVSSIESVDATDSIDPAEYFDLQGRRVDNPRPGSIYLMRHGAVTTKVKF